MQLQQVFGAETMIFFMHLHLPCFCPGILVGMRLRLSESLELFIAAAVLAVSKTDFAYDFFFGGGGGEGFI